eukprot:365630-Chlamydomonas_euryale.AAC.11
MKKGKQTPLSTATPHQALLQLPALWLSVVGLSAWAVVSSIQAVPHACTRCQDTATIANSIPHQSHRSQALIDNAQVRGGRWRRLAVVRRRGGVTIGRRHSTARGSAAYGTRTHVPLGNRVARAYISAACIAAQSFTWPRGAAGKRCADARRGTGPPLATQPRRRSVASLHAWRWCLGWWANTAPFSLKPRRLAARAIPDKARTSSALALESCSPRSVGCGPT